MRSFFKNIWFILTCPFRFIRWLVFLPLRILTKLYQFLNEKPQETELPEIFSTSVQKPVLLLGHINALRKHIARIVLVLLLFVLLMFGVTDKIIDFLAIPIGGLEALTAIDVTESVGVFMRVALLGAVVITSPYMAFEFWLFAAPGLMPRAKKMGLLGIPLVLIFFTGGILFTYWVLLPTALPFLLNFMGIQALPRVSSYINFVTGLMFWIGLSFEFPLLVYILTIMKIMKPIILTKHWRIALVIIALLAAVITPTPDPINMSIVMAPLILLYLLSIGLSYIGLIGRKKQKETDRLAL